VCTFACLCVCARVCLLTPVLVLLQFGKMAVSCCLSQLEQNDWLYVEKIFFLKCLGLQPHDFPTWMLSARRSPMSRGGFVYKFCRLVVVGLTYGCKSGGNLQGLSGWIAASASLGSLGTVADHSQIYGVRAPALVALTGLYDDGQGCTMMECFLGLSSEDNQNNTQLVDTLITCSAVTFFILRVWKWNTPHDRIYWIHGPPSELGSSGPLDFVICHTAA